ncbi:hypothetical protein J6590_019341 [Homalodisca vitripennis]|nr:hypothetical protein J6590_019341 [Homalodisca vitripennis]
MIKRIQRLSQDNRIKQRRAWLLLGWVTAERSCPCKQSAFPAIADDSEVTFKPLVPRLSVREGFLAQLRLIRSMHDRGSRILLPELAAARPVVRLRSGASRGRENVLHLAARPAKYTMTTVSPTNTDTDLTDTDIGRRRLLPAGYDTESRCAVSPCCVVYLA